MAVRFFAANSTLLNTTINGRSTNYEGWNGGKGVFWGAGNFGGGTLSLEMSVAGSTFIACSGVSLTSDGTVLFELPPGVSIAAKVTSGSTSLSLYCGVHGMSN
jgi:hypothetical protein